MPRLISRDEALAEIRGRGGAYGCLMCALRDGFFGPTLTLHEDEKALVILPQYVRRWGHILLILREHVTSFTAARDDDWLHLCRLAARAARVAEASLSPRRCYVASTGSSGGELTQSSEHLHLHVIPLYEPDDRPASVFSWAEGLWVADDDEWRALLTRYREAWQDDALTGTPARMR